MIYSYVPDLVPPVQFTPIPQFWTVVDHNPLVSSPLGSADEYQELPTYLSVPVANGLAPSVPSVVPEPSIVVSLTIGSLVVWLAKCRH